MTRNYLIFVPEKDVDEDAVEYSGVVEWCYKNLSHPNVIVLTLDDVYLLQYRSEVLDIINEENNSMLQEGEDDWVLHQEVKSRIQQKLLEYKNNIKDKREKDIVEYLLKLLEISIGTNKSLYFIF
jgi:hypothetical protein